MKWNINKKFFLTIAFAVSILLAGRVVFAVWDGFPYDPGETLDPECLPTDIDCDVLAPVTNPSGALEIINTSGGLHLLIIYR